MNSSRMSLEFFWGKCQGGFFEVSIFYFFHPCFSGDNICIENFARISVFKVFTISTVILKHWLNFIFIAECSSCMFCSHIVHRCLYFCSPC